MDITSLLFSSKVRPKVLHSLPGRVRIHIPIIKKISPYKEFIDAILQSLCAKNDALESISCQISTGNILICYNSQRITEERIVNLLEYIGKFLLKHRKEIENIDVDTLDIFQEMNIDEWETYCLKLFKKKGL